ncbi:protein-glutamate O-methyltransferase CheR [Paenibacillus sp. S3N08]|uniref:Protein-glutamate O-methyltransferase CheR n=2 Tax=Paenibacillus agricola TaxID=2716264 RepID=A0ABX0JB88_9BACL|nr:protein-glutamate O-methyltransferase CheR [Paenibacillus agricola]
MIHKYCGIKYDDNLFSLNSKVQQRLGALQVSLRDYLLYLEATPGEWDTLVESITINETYFFREEMQMQEMMNNVLPKLAANDSIRIWSAACSTGEEPYTIAMSIANSHVIPLSKVEIYATDINRKVLQLAEQGWYSKTSMCFRRTPQEMKNKFFIKDELGYRLRDSIRERVQFSHINLTDEDRKASSQDRPLMDVIFCRNVLIYFDQPTVRQVIQHLSQWLKPGGYLFLGHAETITGMIEEFQTINTATTHYYRKSGGSQ